MAADIGLMGLAVMGQNLVLNIADHGYTVAVYNRTASVTDKFLQGSAKGKKILGAYDVRTFVHSLKRPRNLLLMVKAGASVDDCIEQLLSFVEAGDLVIDGGNSHFLDSQRRYEALQAKGIHFIGMGVSGGEEGARHGPSIMPGGSDAAWPRVQPILQAIAARSEDGTPCCSWIGSGGAGHYVKMVHNGIEYGDMQLISEAYDLLRSVAHFSHEELHDLFKKWNRGSLESYLIEITADIVAKRDADGAPLLDKILDVAGQKGTGKWTVLDALQRGEPLTLIGEAVFARCVSALKEERLIACRNYPEEKSLDSVNPTAFADQIAQALYASKIISYAQGFMLIQSASKEHRWDLDLGAIALVWRGGCIIRSRFLTKIYEAYRADPTLRNLLLTPYFTEELTRAIPSWRKTVSIGALHGIPLPCFGAALSFFDGYRRAVLPANLLQAQRDYFGAHTYERIDQPRNQFFHTNWTGKGGDVSSTPYSG